MALTRGVRESDLGLPKAVPSICIFILFSALLSACRADVQSIDPGLQGEYGSTPELTRHPTGANVSELNGAINSLFAPFRAVLVPHAYTDDLEAPPRIDGPSARNISNKLFSRLPGNNPLLTNDLQTIWGQLTVLDICNTVRGIQLRDAYPFLIAPANYTLEQLGIPIPVDDLFYNPTANESLKCPLQRSAPHPSAYPFNPTAQRNQFMDITGWLDASWLYGSVGWDPHAKFTYNEVRAKNGAGDYTCKLNNSYWFFPHELELTFIPETTQNIAIWKRRGDLRTNKTPDLIALTEVFGLEHNRLCDEFEAAHPEWTQDRLFEEARKWIIAFMQKITTREWLAADMGVPLNSTYYGQVGYDPTVDAGIENFFCSVAMRYGHSEVNSQVFLADDDYKQSSIGNILVRDWYFQTKKIDETPGMIEDLLRGLTVQRQGLVDTSFVDDLRNYMFSTPTWNQFSNPGPDFLCGDLPATNIQRARDHGMPDYNAARVQLGLTPITTWTDLTNDTEVVQILAELYPGGVGTLDPYVGGLFEVHVTGAHVGELFHKVIMDQFERLRNGDRFWYERKGMFTPAELAIVHNTTIMDIISRNMNVTKWGSTPGESFFLQQRYLANIGGDQFFRNSDEYDNFVDLSPAYRLSWTPDKANNAIRMMIQCRNSGWVGVGFDADEATMKNADIHICRRWANDTWEFIDAYALDVGPPTRDQTLSGGSNNLFDTSAEYEGGVVTCRFSKRISTEDPWDKTITEGLNKVIFAFNPTENELVYHGPTRSSAARLNLLNTCLGSDCSSDDTAAIIGGVVGGVGGALLLCLILLVLLAIVLLLLARRKKKEAQLLLAEEWSDDEASIEMDDMSESSASSSASVRSSALLGKQLSLMDLESVNLTFEPKVLTFGLGSNDKCPVDEEVSDEIVLTNHGPARRFTFFVPTENDKFACRLHPGSGVIKSGKSVTVHVHVTLLMTTNIERKIKFDVEGLGSHLITIKLVGELSTKLDPDDIITTNPPIGQGSFGTVYKANYRGQEVAAKVLNSQMDRRQLAEFQKEVDIMTRLRCPYVLNFVGASFVPGKTCLVTELCTHGSVSDVVFSEQNFNYLLMLKVALDMAKAISFLHTDIKPDNFLIVSLSAKAPVSCKIADFGTSRSITQAQEAFNHTAALGTPIYMAPEILEHKPYSAKIDVYSFGVMLWVLYTRREPYTELKRQWDIPKYVIKGNRPTVPDHCPEPLRELFNQCWTHDPRDRLDMSEVVTLLEKLFEEEKALKGQRNEAERGGRKARASGRAQTARGFDEEEEERVGARTWEGGRKGLVDDDAANQKHDVEVSSSSDSGSDSDFAPSNKKGKQKKDKRNHTGGI
ncbi:protein kinase domain containing protein [Acanthamoeba castellanii str. Neff]|uniref:Protein kinase domain containing protein n=1 Tax=Acanthamoeba castellanii (strain ATCC 30010 / Neff) TaxID=1257118 RepID=L8GUB1_ACACF|nr:protein kinase domain containing protein [Acanthamoeba castellanii str. Neff]ELR16527.1 protein kinase domain containing protein [Acanthamoeba castellanii str. Neff]